MIQVSVTGALPDMNPDWGTVMDEASTIMLEGVEEIMRQGGPRELKWPPLRSGEPSRLYESGTLVGGLSKRHDEDSAEAGVYGVPYARYVQEGGHPHVTERSKRYFWARYKDTKDPKWKYMALQRVGTVMNIPPRPFVVWTMEMIEAVTKKIGQAIIETTSGHKYKIG